jgi:hypothetical protein
MKIKSLIIFLICLIISCFNRLAMANFPTCPPCYYMGPYGCLYSCNQNNCQWCVNGSCQKCGGNQHQFCCNGGCCDETLCQECVDGGCWECGRRPCEHCVNGQCESHCNAAECQRCVDGSCRGCDPISEACCSNGITGQCFDPWSQVCCNGQVYTWPEHKCCKDGTNEWVCDSDKECCNGNCCDPAKCESCVDGQCKVCGGDPSMHCENGQCVCNNCYDIDAVPSSVVPPSCPDCSGFLSGCEGTQMVVNGYDQWQSATSSGFCKNPTTTDIVGFYFQCQEDWSVTKLLSCAGQATICVNLCKNAKDKFGYAACAACLVVAGINCALDGVCAFVSDCSPRDDPDDDGDNAIPIWEEVIDWGGDFGNVCHVG